LRALAGQGLGIMAPPRYLVLWAVVATTLAGETWSSQRSRDDTEDLKIKSEMPEEWREASQVVVRATGGFVGGYTAAVAVKSTAKLSILVRKSGRLTDATPVSSVSASFVTRVHLCDCAGGFSVVHHGATRV
jgi:hypothetical protein